MVGFDITDHQNFQFFKPSLTPLAISGLEIRFVNKACQLGFENRLGKNIAKLFEIITSSSHGLVVFKTLTFIMPYYKYGLLASSSLVSYMLT